MKTEASRSGVVEMFEMDPFPGGETGVDGEMAATRCRVGETARPGGETLTVVSSE